MTIQVDRTKQEFILDDSMETDIDLTGYQFCFINSIGSTTGSAKASLCTGAGARAYGVLRNYNAITAAVTTSGGLGQIPQNIAEVAVEGITEVYCSSAVNAGVEVMVGGTNGKVVPWTAGNYVVGIAREAGVAGQLISILLLTYYH